MPHRRHVLAVGLLLMGAAVKTVTFPAGLQADPTDRDATLPKPRPMVTARLRTGSREGIPLVLWSPPRRTGTVIIGVHSFGDYRMAFGETAERLARDGHVVIAYDQPGFGSTNRRGEYASDDIYRDHLAHVVRFARTHAPDTPIVVMAESFGASVAISALARGKIAIDGLVLSGPGVRENLPAKSLWDGLISTVAHVFGPRSVRLSQANPLMSDVAQLRFAEDLKIVRDIRADTYERVVALADLASFEAHKVKVPTLVLYGSEDGIIARSSVDALMARLGSSGTLKVYDQRPHLVLQAKDREDVDRDLGLFLRDILRR